ncbi:Venom protein [Caenorhabditis elegans]|uniref:Venom protein n=1 Tax=Caenorhabditis elegans TaxID=6239 RepID=E3CTH1_CAEEL|nr:Venom protein [Caenorhabditis elegans]CCD65239.1 Venom protein [Caenorhabditis elegans]|eukprot:NP_001256051.1 Uncharacterized protein CELE_Y60C6A.2 [Caenorhabditis elegans]
MLCKIFIPSLLSLFIISTAFDKDLAHKCLLSCVNSGNRTEWESCEKKCFDQGDDEDKAFITCYLKCVDLYFTPDGKLIDFDNFEKCAKKCPITTE